MEAYAFNRIPVDSTSIAAIAFSAELNIMDVAFHRGATYRYSLVPGEVFSAFINAPSKGGYFNAQVRDRYPCRKL